MKKLKLNKVRAWLRRFVPFFGVVVVLLGSGLAVGYDLLQPQSGSFTPTNVTYPTELRTEYASLVQYVRTFEDKQTKAQTKLVTDEELQRMLSRVQIDAASGQFREAKADMKTLRTALDNWSLELKGGTPVASNAGTGSGSGVFIPILLYHYTPPNFEQQLVHLEQHGYTVIDLDEAQAGLRGGPLPPKPVVITYDDGFANQMQAFELLKKHHMKATFYIIAGGDASHWCIGAGRRYNDPSQPPGGCGDAYLTWDQVRELDASGLITIGGHTFNHRNLASLSAPEQQFEIVQSKAAIEQEIGHPIKHFAYPYGSYNATSIALVREAGYTTATTTLPGSYQAPGGDFTLRRVRDTLNLP